ncbi:hypothetical protein EGT74_13640 [Chitinophaga lutea]|uniref:Uncharacterized protein n=1 Tax=Chitinophaga lutea TaxID=2488634 RepID=A0A3N4PIQ7_9BACT|nr:hypothetical protein [Chitinophaga lutea]RPE08106.1 hypothetical protein EGT74_13640 [Chitinophaga lutea]
MSENVFTQRNFLHHKKRFEIKVDGLNVQYRHLLGKSDFFVKFEDLGIKTIKSVSGNKPWLVAAFCCVFLAIFLLFLKMSGRDVEEGSVLFYFAIAALCICGYCITYKRLLYLARNDNSNGVAFLLDKPTAKALEDFVQLLKRRRNEYLIEKYGQVTKLMPYEQQRADILWLNNIDALTHDEYHAKIQELNMLFMAMPGLTDFHLS